MVLDELNYYKLVCLNLNFAKIGKKQLLLQKAEKKGKLSDEFRLLPLKGINHVVNVLADEINHWLHRVVVG